MNKYFKYIIFLVIISFFAYLLFILIPIDGYELSTELEELRNEIISDGIILKNTMNDLNASLSDIKSINFNNTFDYNENISIFWQNYLNSGSKLDELSYKYSHFYQIDYLDEKELHETAFLIGFTSLLVEYSSILDLISFAEGNLGVEHLLGKDYINLKTSILLPDNVVLINSWTAYYDLLKHSEIDNCSFYCSLIEDKLIELKINLDLAAKSVLSNSLEDISFEKWFS